MPKQQPIKMVRHGQRRDVVLTIQDNHVNLQTMPHLDPDFRGLLKTSKKRFLNSIELDPLFEAAADNLLPISPDKPPINREGLYFVISDAYRDGTGYKVVNKNRHTQSGKPEKEGYNFTEAKLETHTDPPITVFIRRNQRKRSIYNTLACIHYLRVNEDTHQQQEIELEDETSSNSFDTSDELPPPKQPAVGGGSKIVYTENLPYQVESSELENFFKEAGEVVAARIAYGNLRGLGYVEFASAEAAEKALELDHKPLRGRKIKLTLAKQGGPQYSDELPPPKQPAVGGGSKIVYTENLPYQVESSELENFFKEAGEVVAARIAYGNLRGLGYVEFASAEAAEKALELDHKPLRGRKIKLTLANHGGPGSSRRGEGNQVKTIFVTGFNKSLGAYEIKAALGDHFSACGEITRIAVPTDRQTRATRGIAFIDLKDGFNKALELNGSEFGGRNIVVKEARPRVKNDDGNIGDLSLFPGGNKPLKKG